MTLCLSTRQLVEDLAFVVDDGVTSAEIEKVIHKAGGFLLKQVDLFDLYVGDNIPTGKKSLAYRLTYQSPDKTLRDKDIVKLRKKVTSSLKHQVGAVLRE